MKQPLVLLVALLLTQCQKSDPDPISQLPPATQTGANTFGCLLNGQAWTPQGSDGTANYSVSYDPTYHGGNLDIKVYRLNGSAFQYIIFGGDSLSRSGVYSLSRNPRTVFFTDSQKPITCQNLDGNAGQYRRGSLTITRLDKVAGIISGTFAFTLYKAGCDSVRITQGRFDKKL